MTTLEVAKKLVTLCREGKPEVAIRELFADDAISIEADDLMVPKFTKGKQAIIEKINLYHSILEAFYGQEISEPIVGGTYFSVSWMVDATFKGRGREQLTEICVYNVSKGKIVSEQFFY